MGIFCILQGSHYGLPYRLLVSQGQWQEAQELVNSLGVPDEAQGDEDYF